MREVEIREGIRNYLLSEWQNLVLLYPVERVEDTKYRTMKAFCFKVTSTNFLLRTGIEGTEVPSEDGIDYERLTDAEGEDLLRNNEEPWSMYHYSLGVLEDDLRIYPRCPSSQFGGGFTYLTAEHPRPQEGDDYGYVPSAQIDYWNPPLELENVSYMYGKETDITYGFWNQSDRAITPTLSIVGASYLTMPVTRTSEKKKMVSGAVPRRIVSWGYAIRDSWTFEVPDEWEDAGCDITIDRFDIQGGESR